MKVVLGTNLFVKAIGRPDGIPGQVVDLWKRVGKFELICSLELINEFAQTTNPPRLWNGFLKGVPQNYIDDLVKTLFSLPNLITDICVIRYVPSDPDYDKVLWCVWKGKADYIVRGDKAHLLVLGEFEGIPIVSPKDFLNLIQNPPLNNFLSC